MSKNIENAILLDTYGSMLTEKQYDTLSLYYDEDLSLSEIAENMGITRQGVHKCIRTSEEYLTQLEETLGFAEKYRETVQFFAGHKGKIVAVTLFTVLQRCSVFFLTYLVYLGFHLKGTDALTVMMLQASVYIAVDMLPLPGAQGITELMYFRRGISGNFSYGIHVCVPWNKFLLFVDNFRNSYGDCIYPGMEVQQKETRRNRRIQLTLIKFPHIIKVSVL